MNFKITQSRIFTLAKHWKLSDSKLTIAKLSDPEFQIPPNSIPISYQFYPKYDSSESLNNEESSKGASSESNNDNLVTIDIPNPSENGDVDSVYKMLIEKYNVPEEHQLSLYHQIRVSMYVSDPILKNKLLTIRLLAMAITVILVPEQIAQSVIFLYDPNLIPQLAEIIHPDNKASMSIQIASIEVLNSISHHRGKLGEVLASINANANHGILLHILRHFVNPLSNINQNFTKAYADTFFSFLSYILSTQMGGSMLVNAGIIKKLVDLIENPLTPCFTVRILTKAIQLLDNVVYGFGNSFNFFQEAQGVNILIEKIKTETEKCLELSENKVEEFDKMDLASHPDAVISEHTVLLKSMLKFIIHMLQSSNVRNGLRNLSELSLPNSLKTVFSKPQYFSPSVYSATINVLSNIIHNEPTSLSILQEADVPQTLLRSLKESIPASIDVINSICNCFGAICLNEAGIKSLTESTVINDLFKIFLNTDYLLCIREADFLSSLGSSLDELVRHHPALLNLVLDNILALLKNTCELGNVDNYSKWAESNSEVIHTLATSINSNLLQPDSEAENIDKTNVEAATVLVSYIECNSKFLESFFQTSSHTDYFIEQSGIELLIDTYLIPSLPYDFTNMSGAYALSHLLRILCRLDPDDVIQPLGKKLNQILKQSLEPFSEETNGSHLLKYIENGDSKQKPAIVDQFSQLLGLISLVSDFCSSTVLSHVSSTQCLMESFYSGELKESLPLIGQIQRICAIENYHFKNSKYLVFKQDGVNGDLNNIEYTAPHSKSLYYLIIQLNTTITSLLQGLTKLLMSRRSMEKQNRIQGCSIGKEIGNLLVNHLTWERVSSKIDDINFNYYISIFTLLRLLLLDDRNQSYVQLCLLYGFETHNGISTSIQVFEQLWKYCESKLVDEPSNSMDQDDVLEKANSNDLKFVLAYFDCLTAFRLFYDSPHLSNLMVNESEEADSKTIHPNDFIIKSRHLIGPALTLIWKSEHLSKFTSNFINSLFTVSGNIIKGQLLNIEPAVTRLPPPVHLNLIFPVRRPEPNQQMVQQLTEMGFPSGAAEIALVRCNNNLNRAAEYLVSHPEVVATASFNPSDNNQQSENQESSNENADTTEPAQDQPAEGESSSNQPGQTESGEPAEPAVEDPIFKKTDISNVPTLEQLETSTEELYDIIFANMFSIVDNVDNSVFGARDLLAMLLQKSSTTAATLEMIENELKNRLAGPDNEDSIAPLGRRLRLLALLSTKSANLTLLNPIICQIFPSLVPIVQGHISDSKSETTSTCLASALLCIELCIAFEESLRLKPESEVDHMFVVGSSSRTILMGVCLEYLKTEEYSKDIILAIYRILARLTKHEEQVVQFVSNEGVQLLLSPFTNSSSSFVANHDQFTVILRHIMENQKLLHFSMSENLKRWFIHPRPRMVDINSFLKSNSHVAMRDPELFVKSVIDISKLKEPSTEGRPNQLIYKYYDQPVEEEFKDENFCKPVPVLSESSIHTLYYLLSELQKLFDQPDVVPKNDNDMDVSDNEDKEDPKVDSKEDTKEESNSKDQITPKEEASYLYKCFLLQVLSEILFCFPSCRIELFSSGKLSKSTHSPPFKSRSSLLSFLINDILLKPTNSNLSKSRRDLIQQTSSWTLSLLCAICIGESDSVNDPYNNELISVRKSVLDVISRSIQDTLSIRRLDTKYKRLSTLAELCHKILTCKKTPGGGTSKTDEDVTLSIVKLMIEKNFVSLLVTCINELDLNYTSIKNTINSLLKPLEILSKHAIKLGNPDQLESLPKELQEFSVDAHAIESSDSEAEERADFYRNSSLRMLGGDLDVSEHEDDLSSDEEEIYDMSADDSSNASDRNTEDEMDDIIEIIGSDHEHGDDDGEDSDEEDDDDDDEHDMEDEHDHDDGIHDDINSYDEEDHAGNVMEFDEDGDELIDEMNSENDQSADWDIDDLEMDIDQPQQLVPEVVLSEFNDQDMPIDQAVLSPSELLDGHDEIDDRSSPRSNFNASQIGRIGRNFDLNGTSRPTGIDLNPIRLSNIQSEFLNLHDSLLSGGPRSILLGSSFNANSVHPLLSNPPDQSDNPLEALSNRRGQGESRQGMLLSDMIGNSTAQLVTQLLQRNSGGRHGELVNDHIATISSPNLQNMITSHIDPSDRSRSLRLTVRPGGDSANNPATIIYQLSLLSSHERWYQENNFLNPTSNSDQSLSLSQSIIQVLAPLAAEESQANQQEQSEQADESQPEPMDAISSPQPFESSFIEPGMEDNDNGSNANDSVHLNQSQEENDPEDTEELTEQAQDEPAESSANNQESSATQNVEDSQTEAAPQREPILYSVNGRMVDISHTDMDPTFLDALPEDMLQEVLAQRFPEPEPENDANEEISPEFLNALPDDIRMELLANASVPGSENIPPPRFPDQQTVSSIISNSLNRYPSQFRNRTFDWTNPMPNSHNPAENQSFIEFNRRPASSRTGYLPRFYDQSNQASNDSSSQKDRHPKHTIQLVDYTALTSIVRLLFLPQTLSKNSVHKLLINLCENANTCSNLISILLSIIQDCPNDIQALDRSFANLSLQHKSSQKPMVKPKMQFNTSNEGIDPNLIIKRCIQTLSYLISSNSLSIRYFLNEHQTVYRKTVSKKSKGKEKTIETSNPLVALIFLLDHPSILSDLTLVEQLMHLLSSITRYYSAQYKSYIEKSAASKSENPQSSSTKTEASKSDSSNQQTLDKHTSVTKPIQIPDSSLKTIINALASGECTSKTFQYTLSVIQHISIIEKAQNVFFEELAIKSQKLQIQISEDLAELEGHLSSLTDGKEITKPDLIKFSQSSSVQAKLLRLLKTLDYFHTRRKQKNGDSEKKGESSSESHDFKFQQVYHQLLKTDIWKHLSSCLSLIVDKEEMNHVATLLLPLIEAFMVIFKHSGFLPTSSNAPKRETDELKIFDQFTERHRKILNLLLRLNPSLMSGSFSILLQNHKVLDFDNKRNYFRQQLHKRSNSRDQYGSLQLNVRRSHVFEDSYHQLQGRTGDEIKYGKLNVKFHDEEGVDAGGVTREWSQVLSRQMFNPDYALFKTSAVDRVTYQPNRSSWVNSDHLSYFKFVGRVIGKAIYDNRLLDCYFTRSFYKHILGKTVEIRDMEAADPTFYRSLMWMNENDITGVLDLTFSMEDEEFGEKRIVDLKPNGRDIPVTEENKQEYIHLITQQKLTVAIKDQIKSFLTGFNEIIPPWLIRIFNEQELELLISGLPYIDVDDWKNNTEYQGYTESSPQIQWFWRAVRSFDQEERTKLLQFVTGTSKVPLEGFSNLQGSGGVQKFQIHKDFSSIQRLPSAHTW